MYLQDGLSRPEFYFEMELMERFRAGISIPPGRKSPGEQPDDRLEPDWELSGTDKR